MWFVGPGNPVRPAARFQLFFPSESITCRESLVPGVCYSEAGRSLRERPPLEVQVSPLCNRIFQPTPRPSAAGSEKVRPSASSPLNADPPLARWPGLCLAKPSQFRPCRLPAPRRGPTLPNEPKFVSAGNCLFPLNQRLAAICSLSDRFAEPTQFRPFPHSPLGGSSFWRNKPNSSPFHPPAPRTPVLPNEP